MCIRDRYGTDPKGFLYLVFVISCLYVIGRRLFRTLYPVQHPFNHLFFHINIKAEQADKRKELKLFLLVSGGVLEGGL